MKILFVEDDEQISRVAKLIFVNTEHDVVLSPTPECAIQALQNDSFDAVILDLTFPQGHGTGEDVLTYISNHKLNVPVFIHSGYVGKYKEVVNYYKIKGIVKKIFNKPDVGFMDMLAGINESVTK